MDLSMHGWRDRFGVRAGPMFGRFFHGRLS